VSQVIDVGAVTTTAAKSFVGKTAGLVTSSKDQGHFQRVMTSIGTTLLILVVVFLFAVWIGGFFRSVKISTPTQNNLLVYTLIFLVRLRHLFFRGVKADALQIIGVPVGLPCVTTTTLAVGAAYLARKQAIVQQLTAVESLAGCDMLCSDKTGTLTANKLSIHEPYVAEGVDINWLMCVAVLASSHNIKVLDPSTCGP
jgi:H+-transporting ATPase